MASHASLTPPYHLPALNKDESWELFSKKVFPGGSCPTNLETLGRQILESCKGLPLSIVVLAGILANKEKKYETWANFNGHVYGNPNKDTGIMLLPTAPKLETMPFVSWCISKRL
jgi:hypothetical protein